MKLRIQTRTAIHIPIILILSITRSPYSDNWAMSILGRFLAVGVVVGGGSGGAVKLYLKQRQYKINSAEVDLKGCEEEVCVPLFGYCFIDWEKSGAIVSLC
ncbi:hypothetical protein BCR42DRAFT_412424 [Absidia repens]|uniref:Uncharacterized protein n=1 Tax=Absidia repens TaxID=90262 RepID=A0A1X2IJM6_9FUNG|nr:hypothetical protein BCR42DRAFT_412424 [Absidia repens]